MNANIIPVVTRLFDSGSPILRINGLLREGARWHRRVKSTDSRFGPWLPADYEITDEEAWNRRSECLYFVSSGPSQYEYVGRSVNRVKDRWRLSPGWAEDTNHQLPEKQLFHSQCWPHIEQAFRVRPSSRFEVRAIFGEELESAVRHTQSSGLLEALLMAGTSRSRDRVVAAEKWLLKRGRAPQSPIGGRLFEWNAH